MMDPSTWKTAGALMLFATVVMIGVGAADWGACLNARQTLLQSGPPESMLIVGDDWNAIESIYNAADAIPESAVDRAKLVAPTCDVDAPLSDGSNWYMLAGVLFLVSVFCFVSARPRKMKIEPTRRTRPTREVKTKTKDPIDVATPIEISLDEVSEAERQRDSQTLMAFVEERRTEESETSLSETSAPRLDGFYVPPGYDTKPIIYVDASATVDSNEDNTRFRDINEALKNAQRMVLKGAGGVQVRVAPGVYQTSIEIPSNVVVVNQRLPDGGDAKSRLKWLLSQELDSPDRVTILANADAEFGVRFGPGMRHGIFGCFIVGRKGVSHTGVLLENAETAAIVHCVIEGFSNSGVRVVRVGSELPGMGLVIAGSMIRENTAQNGGGIFATESSLAIESSIIEENRARNGGGVYIESSRHPSSIKGTRLAHNRAQLPDNPSEDPMKHRLVQWGTDRGLGGGLYVTASHAKLIDLECVDNGASIAGGGAAFLGSKVLVQNQDHRSKFSRNRARIGGGLFVVGWPANDATLKIQEIDIQENIAQVSGGGASVVGYAVTQAIDCVIQHNESNGPSGIGGGVSCHIGGNFDAQAGSVSQNKSTMHGGGIATINGRLRLGGQTQIHDNTAGGSGGGIFTITEPCAVTEHLVAHETFDLPFRILIDDATVRYNKCKQTGSGFRAGNLEQQPTLPIGFKVHQASIRSNTSAIDTSDVFVTWAGSVITTDVHQMKKRLLK